MRKTFSAILVFFFCSLLALPVMAAPPHPVSAQQQNFWAFFAIAMVGIYWLVILLGGLALFSVLLFIWRRIFGTVSTPPRGSNAKRSNRSTISTLPFLLALWPLITVILLVFYCAKVDMTANSAASLPFVYTGLYIVGLILWRLDVGSLRKVGYHVGFWQYWGLFLNIGYLFSRASETDGKRRWFWIALVIYAIPALGIAAIFIF